jgi:tetratricopeptide (TPR) repeat protein
MLCPKCRYDNTSTARFCESCGAKLARLCASCGEEVGPQAQFCSACGAPVAPPGPLRGQAIDTGAPADRLTGAPDGERRQLTVLFCDLVGSTEIAAQLDPEEWRDIPATLHDSLMARLDRLGPAKEVAQLGAVIGREFSYALLHDVVQAVRHPTLPDAELHRALERITSAELLYARGIRPEATYVFKHALVQDAAYVSLLKSRRRELHRLIAATLTDRYADTTTAQPEVVAYHYEAAGEAELALTYYQQAGERAALRSAHEEAVAHLRKAIALLDTLPEGRERGGRAAALHRAVAPSLICAEALKHPLSIAFGRFFLIMVHWLRGEAGAQRRTAEELVRFAEVQVIPFWLVGAKMWRGNARADPAEVTEGMTLTAGSGMQTGAPAGFAALAEAYQARGQHSEALGAVGMGLAVSAETGQRCTDADLHRLKGEIILEQWRVGTVHHSSSDAGGQALGSAHPLEEAASCFRRAIEIARSQEGKSFELRAATSLARLLRDQGKRAEARVLLAPIYAWFTEGFGTRDLIEAKALLEELA